MTVGDSIASFYFSRVFSPQVREAFSAIIALVVSIQIASFLLRFLSFMVSIELTLERRALTYPNVWMPKPKKNTEYIDIKESRVSAKNIAPPVSPSSLFSENTIPAAI